MPITPLPGQRVLTAQTATVRVNVVVRVSYHDSSFCLPRFDAGRSIAAGCGYISCDYDHSCQNLGFGLINNVGLGFDPSPDATSTIMSQGGRKDSSGGSSSITETVTFGDVLGRLIAPGTRITMASTRPCGCLEGTYSGSGENATTCTITGTV
jgi:hypothetical protein